MRASRGLTAFARVTAAGLFIVILMGALVTETGSGRGCGGTWPLCNGHFVPALALTSLIEYSHRAVAALVGTMTGVLAIWAWVKVRAPAVRLLAAVGLGFVVVQALLGGADVLWPEAPAVLALHYGFSLIAFAAVLLLAIELTAPAAPARVAPPAPFARLAWITLIYTYLLVYLGAYVAHVGAAGGCRGWPLCNGQILPLPLEGLTAVNFVHRLAALGGLVLVAWLVAATRHLGAARPDLRRAAVAALALIVLQALTGAWIELSGAALGAVLVHGSLVALLFGALAALARGVVGAAGASVPISRSA